MRVPCTVLSRVFADPWFAALRVQVQGKAIISTCSENSELLPTIDQKIEESDASLKCLCYGDDIWFLYFEVSACAMAVSSGSCTLKQAPLGFLSWMRAPLPVGVPQH